MITDRHIELYRLVEMHGCSPEEAGRMIEPPVKRRRAYKMLEDIYNDKPILKPIKKGEITVNRYEEHMDCEIIRKF